MTAYNKQFYDQQMEGSRRSAREIVPLVLELLRPTSVVDVGCGVGTWLSVYIEAGLTDVKGVDGDYVDMGRLLVDPSCFSPKDLSQSFSLGRRFDLVQSLEVAEHIDERYANVFVENLVALGDAILFSAAVPHQLGTNHVNERFIDYWAELFARHGFVLVDCMRPAIWENAKVEVWYRQNMVVFAKPQYLGRNARLMEYGQNACASMRSVVHPELYSMRIAGLLQLLTECAREFQTLGRNDLALKVSEMTVHFDPRSGKGWDLFAQLEAQRKNFSAALLGFQKAVSLEPDNAAFVANLGVILDAMGDAQGARKYFQRALELNPALNQARKRLEALNAKHVGPS